MEKALSLSLGDLQYHLQQLENGGLITSHDDGRRKRYFVKQEINYLDRELISFIQMRTPRKIMMILLLHPGLSFKELLSEFPFTKGALSFHLKKLLNAQILLQTKQEHHHTYKVNDEERVRNLLIIYRSKIFDDAADGFIDLWTKL